jgi:ATP-dependent Zn protease
MKQYILLLLIGTNVHAENESSLLRQLFYASYNSNTAAEELYTKTEHITMQSSAILLGYKGAAQIMRCKYLMSPIEKLLSFNRGKKFLEAAIKKERYNTELRFLRFAIQNNAPAFLGYKSNLFEDKKILQAYLDRKQLPTKEDSTLYSNIEEFMRNCSLARESYEKN